MCAFVNLCYNVSHALADSERGAGEPNDPP